MAGRGNPVRGLVKVFEHLERDVTSQNPRVELKLVVLALRFGAQLVSSLGGGFTFAVLAIEKKADILERASNINHTMEAMLAYEMSKGRAKENIGPTRMQIRMKRSADMLRVFFQEILAREEGSLVPALKRSYEEVFAVYIGDNVKRAIFAGMEWMMDKTEFFNLIDNDEQSARDLLRRYISASACVCRYMENVYLSNRVGAELLRWI